MTNQPSVSDADLVRASQAGDEKAAEALYRRYFLSVWRYACARLDGDLHAAEDVTSETFVAAIEGLQTMEADKAPVAAWLFGIARHKLGDQRRRTARASKALRARQLPAAQGTGMGMAVASAMERLSDEERTVLEWKYLDGVSVREIAARLGRTDKAAESLLFRARRSFRDAWARERAFGS